MHAAGSVAVPRYAFTMATIIEFIGPVLVSANEERQGMWSVD